MTYTLEEATNLLHRVRDDYGREAALAYVQEHGAWAIRDLDAQQAHEVAEKVLQVCPHYAPGWTGPDAAAPQVPLAPATTGLKMDSETVERFVPGGGVPELREGEVAAVVSEPRGIYAEVAPQLWPPTAHNLLQDAARAVLDRAAERDVENERSMGRCVRAFNELTGHQLSERDGWLFMAVLKAARATATPTGRKDDYVDGAAYFGLAGESVLRKAGAE